MGGTSYDPRDQTPVRTPSTDAAKSTPAGHTRTCDSTFRLALAVRNRHAGFTFRLPPPSPLQSQQATIRFWSGKQTPRFESCPVFRTWMRQTFRIPGNARGWHGDRIRKTHNTLLDDSVRDAAPIPKPRPTPSAAIPWTVTARSTCHRPGSYQPPHSCRTTTTKALDHHASASEIQDSAVPPSRHPRAHCGWGHVAARPSRR